MERYSHFIYRVKSRLGITKKGFRNWDGLLVIKLLAQHKPDRFSVSVIKINDDLETVDSTAIHDSSSILDAAHYNSILINPEMKQLKLVIGNESRPFISEQAELKLVTEMQKKINRNQIIKGIEIGLIELKHRLSTSS